jgi:hypothetical protein
MKRTASKANKPQLECLEDRQALSTAAWVQDGTLYIQGDEYTNDVDVRIFHDIAVVQAEDGYYESFIMEQIGAIDVQLGDGSDVLKLDSEYGNWNGDSLRVHIDSGAGDDNVEIFGNSEFMQQGDDLAVTIRTQAGADHVEVYLRKVQDAAVSMDIDMGMDHDLFTGSLAGDLVNADVRLNVKAGYGMDRLSFAADMDLVEFGSDLHIDQASTLDVRMLAQRGRDLMDMRFDAKVSGDVDLYEHGGEGADKISADITRGTYDSGKLEIDVIGAKGDDTLGLQYQRRLMMDAPIEIMPFELQGYDLMPAPAATMSFGGGLNPLTTLIRPEIVPGIVNPFDPGHIGDDIGYFPYKYSQARIDGGDGFDRYSATENVTVLNCEATMFDPGDIFDRIRLTDLLGK